MSIENMNVEPDWDKVFKKWAKEKEEFMNMNYTERLEHMIKIFHSKNDVYVDIINYCKTGKIE